MNPAVILADIEAFLTTVPGDITSALAVIAAWKAKDQATLDTLHTQALALANAEAPAGSTPLV